MEERMLRVFCTALYLLSCSFLNYFAVLEDACHYQPLDVDDTHEAMRIGPKKDFGINVKLWLVTTDDTCMMVALPV